MYATTTIFQAPWYYHIATLIHIDAVSQIILHEDASYLLLHLSPTHTQILSMGIGLFVQYVYFRLSSSGDEISETNYNSTCF